MKAVAARAAVVLGAALALEGACRAHLVSPMTLIPPSDMAAEALALLAQPETLNSLAWTVVNVAAAILASIAVGLLAAFILHRRPRLRRALDPFLASYYAVPFFVLYPIFVAILGLNRWPLILIGFVFAVPGMLIAVLDGLDGVPPIIFKLSRLYRMSRGQTIARLTLPAVAPAVFTGIKLTVAYSFIGIIAGEFILADRGLGFAIADAYNRFDNRTMYGLMLLVLALVVAANSGVHAAERRLRRRWERP
jgi:NitT/TauT family transport system permease protein